MNSSSSRNEPTPRTDALAETFWQMPDWHAIVDAAVEHAKMLERELSARSERAAISGTEQDWARARTLCGDVLHKADRYDWLTRLFALEITLLVHKHHTHGPTSSEVHGASDAAMAADRQGKA